MKFLNILLWVLVLGVIGLWYFKQINPSCNSCLQENTVVPVVGKCFSSDVLSYGRPTYASDPAMQHMAGHPCYTTEQCQKWPPEGSTGTHCCAQTGECVKNV